jgi:hypothetical protein
MERILTLVEESFKSKSELNAKIKKFEGSPDFNDNESRYKNWIEERRNLSQFINNASGNKFISLAISSFIMSPNLIFLMFK